MVAHEREAAEAASLAADDAGVRELGKQLLPYCQTGMMACPSCDLDVAVEARERAPRCAGREGRVPTGSALFVGTVGAWLACGMLRKMLAWVQGS